MLAGFNTSCSVHVMVLKNEKNKAAIPLTFSHSLD
jgi:hypothetical protein